MDKYVVDCSICKIAFMQCPHSSYDMHYSARTCRWEKNDEADCVLAEKITADRDEATRDTCGVRFDLIPAECLIEVAKVFAYGAEKYGDKNWQKNRMTGDKGPINHALKHIVNYAAEIPDDDGPDLKIHLTHAIANLMFEYWYVENIDK